MNKKILFTSIGFTGFGVINAIIFIILACLNIAPSISFGNIYSILLIFLYFLAVWAPVLLTLIFKLRFYLPLVIAYEIFVILALVVGCLWGVYDMNTYYDKIVHVGSGILFALLAHNLLAEAKGNHLNLVWTFITVFAFSMMLGGIWEIWEFSFDALLGENTQHWMGFEGREVLFDTMFDIICDCVGGIAGGIAVIVFEKLKLKKQTVATAEKNTEDEECSTLS